MSYETYKTVKSQEEYFSTWDKDNLDNLNDKLKSEIYSRYIVKALVFQRDDFKCQNENCIYPQSKITLHHIKFRKNNGEDKLKNCITICKTCHQKFHKAQGKLTFRGMTYQVHKKEKTIDWKNIKRDNKKFRKTLKEVHGITISWKLLSILIKFLELPYNLECDTDDD